MTDSRRLSFALPWTSNIGAASSVKPISSPNIVESTEPSVRLSSVNELAERGPGSRSSFLGISLFGKDRVMGNDLKIPLRTDAIQYVGASGSLNACIVSTPEHKSATHKQHRFSFYRNSLFRKQTERNLLDEIPQRALVLGRISENDVTARPVPARRPSVLRKVDLTSTTPLPSSVTSAISATTPIGVPVSAQAIDRRERIKKSISEPFGFRHIVHTDPTQANHLQRAFAGVENGTRGPRARYDAGTRAYLNRVSSRRSMSLTREQSIAPHARDDKCDAGVVLPGDNAAAENSAAFVPTKELDLQSSNESPRARSLRTTSTLWSPHLQQSVVVTAATESGSASSLEEPVMLTTDVQNTEINTLFEKQTGGSQLKTNSPITMTRSTSLNRPPLDVLFEETFVPTSQSCKVGESSRSPRAAFANSLRRNHSQDTGRSTQGYSRPVSNVSQDSSTVIPQRNARTVSPPRPRRPSNDDLQTTRAVLASQPLRKGNWDDLIDFCYDEAIKPDESSQVMLPSLYAIGAPLSYSSLERKSSERKRKSIGQTAVRKSTLGTSASRSTAYAAETRASMTYRPKRTSSIYSSPYTTTELSTYNTFDSELSSIASDVANTNYYDLCSEKFLAELARDYSTSDQISCIARSKRMSSESLSEMSPISSSPSSSASMTDPSETHSRPTPTRLDSNDTVPDLVYSRKVSGCLAALATKSPEADKAPKSETAAECKEQFTTTEFVDDDDLSSKGVRPEVPRRSSRRLRLRRGEFEQTFDVPLPILQSLANAQRLRARIEAERAQRVSLCATAARP